ncbi:retinol dehydrogenase 14 [Lipomyces mesembrius]
MSSHRAARRVSLSEQQSRHCTLNLSHAPPTSMQKKIYNGRSGKIRSSNSKIATALRPGLVAVFAGATSGIGETSLKQFAKNAVRPRIYFIGRSKESGSRIRAELQKLNPEGEYIYKSVDVSLLRSVDNACREIKDKEAAINLLFLSTGTMLSGVDTEEGLNYPVAVAYYARLRFIVNLLPLLRNATDLRRVVTVLAGTREGTIHTNEFQGRNASMLSLGGPLQLHDDIRAGSRCEKCPKRVFYPCFSRFRQDQLWAVFDAVCLVIGPLIATPVNETGERHLFFATSARFPEGGESAAAGSGSGVYSITNDGETAPHKVEQLLGKLRNDGTAQKVWSQVEEEFVRITGAASV